MMKINEEEYDDDDGEDDDDYDDVQHVSQLSTLKEEIFTYNMGRKLRKYFAESQHI